MATILHNNIPVQWKCVKCGTYNTEWDCTECGEEDTSLEGLIEQLVVAEWINDTFED